MIPEREPTHGVPARRRPGRQALLPRGAGELPPFTGASPRVHPDGDPRAGPHRGVDPSGNRFIVDGCVFVASGPERVAAAARAAARRKPMPAPRHRSAYDRASRFTVDLALATFIRGLR